jgi:hypothetical protein
MFLHQKFFPYFYTYIGNRPAKKSLEYIVIEVVKGKHALLLSLLPYTYHVQESYNHQCLVQKDKKMNNNKSTLTQKSQDDIQLDMFEDYEGLDVEDDVFYQFNSKTYYGAKSAYVEVEDYDFDNYGYND